MSPILLGAIVGGGIGIIANVVGQIVAQLLRRRGKVRCFVPGSIRKGPHTSPRHPLNSVVTFGFPLWFFNEKEVGIGITELMLTFYKGGEQLALDFIKEKGSDDPVRTLDLPPRQWVFKEIEFEAGIAQATLEPPREGAPETQEEIRLTWTYPTGKKETRVIPTVGHDERWSQKAKRLLQR